MPFRAKYTLTILSLFILGAWTVFAIAQPGGQKKGGQRPPGNRPGGPGGGQADQGANLPNTQFLLSEKVKAELKITEDQEGQIRSLSERFRRRMLGVSSPRGGTSDELAGMREEFDTELGEILQPDQLQRFKQILVQQELQKDTLAALSGSGEIAKALGVTDEQKKQLRAASRDGEEEVRVGIEKLREDARQKIINALTAEQKEQLGKMTGEKFDIAPPRNMQNKGSFGSGSKGPGKGKGPAGRPNGRPN